MNRLFVELYLDEDVSILVADLLRARGFAPITARDAGRLGKDDREQLAHAVSNQRALLTHNRVDFERLAQEYFRAGIEHHGIIIAARHSPYEVVQRLLLILNHVTADEMRNQIRYI